MKRLIVIILIALIAASGGIGLAAFLKKRARNSFPQSPKTQTTGSPLARRAPPAPSLDPDHDGLKTEDEQKLGTDPAKFDTDGDGLSDRVEVNLKTDPLKADVDFSGPDSDKDGLPDTLERAIGFDPEKTDSDGDGFNDYFEFQMRASGQSDEDNDGLYGIDEKSFGTDPKNPDTDGDGFNDGQEVLHGYNPKGAGKL